ARDGRPWTPARVGLRPDRAVGTRGLGLGGARVSVSDPPAFRPIPVWVDLSRAGQVDAGFPPTWERGKHRCERLPALLGSTRSQATDEGAPEYRVDQGEIMYGHAQPSGVSRGETTRPTTARSSGRSSVSWSPCASSRSRPA